jgi:hypothetical protein
MYSFPLDEDTLWQSYLKPLKFYIDEIYEYNHEVNSEIFYFIFFKK